MFKHFAWWKSSMARIPQLKDSATQGPSPQQQDLQMRMKDWPCCLGQQGHCQIWSSKRTDAPRLTYNESISFPQPPVRESSLCMMACPWRKGPSPWSDYSAHPSLSKRESDHNSRGYVCVPTYGINGSASHLPTMYATIVVLSILIRTWWSLKNERKYCPSHPVPCEHHHHHVLAHSGRMMTVQSEPELREGKAGVLLHRPEKQQRLRAV